MGSILINHIIEYIYTGEKYVTQVNTFGDRRWAQQSLEAMDQWDNITDDKDNLSVIYQEI